MRAALLIEDGVERVSRDPVVRVPQDAVSRAEYTVGSAPNPLNDGSSESGSSGAGSLRELVTLPVLGSPSELPTAEKLEFRQLDSRLDFCTT